MLLSIVRSTPVICVILLAGCSGGGDVTAARPASVVPPASVLTGPVPPSGTVRRTMSAGTCSAAGGGSFDGAPANGNVAGGADSVVSGGLNNLACNNETAVAGGYENVIAGSQDGAAYSDIGGGQLNQIYGTSSWSVIGGGYQNTIDASNGNSVSLVGGAFNSAMSAGSSLVGGEHNTASGFDSMLGGGNANTVSGDYGFDGGGSNNAVSNSYAAVAGGEYNQATGEGSYIGGGGYNTASGEGAIVDGGFNESAAGNFATVPGGYRDSAGGTYSFAAGSYASAAQTGTFVWSDGSNGNTALTSTQAYEFLARASGGFTLYTNAAGTVGAQLAAGSGTWASLSDRNAKTNIAPLDGDAVLAKVDALPISRWSYKSEHGVRHVGPMAQDFYAAFKVGADDKHITSIDEDGVALAAIKALHAENVRLRSELAVLRAAEARHAAHDRRVDAVLARLEARPLR